MSSKTTKSSLKNTYDAAVKMKKKVIKLKQIYCTEYKNQTFITALSEDGLMYQCFYDKKNSPFWKLVGNPVSPSKTK